MTTTTFEERRDLMQDIIDILIQEPEISEPFKSELTSLIAKYKVAQYEVKEGSRVYSKHVEHVQRTTE